MLPMHGPDLLQHPSMRIVETLDEGGQHMHVVAQARDLRGQPPQRLADIFEVDGGLARAFAQDPISIRGASSYYRGVARSDEANDWRSARGQGMFTKEILYGMNLLTLAGFVLMGIGLTL